jgi:hypothetical protein
MSRYVHAGTLASAVALTITAVAGSAPAQSSRQPTPATPRSSASDARQPMVTIEGCLMREADVPGRKPNVAERAGITEDYILTSTKVVKGSAPAAGDPSAPSADTPVGTSGTQATSTMYEVEGIDDRLLKHHAGRRVQIDGTLENADRAAANRERQTPAGNLVELRGKIIRQVAGDCPAR